MFTNIFLEKPDDWCIDPTVYTEEDVEKAIEQSIKEQEESNETT